MDGTESVFSEIMSPFLRTKHFSKKWREHKETLAPSRSSFVRLRTRGIVDIHFLRITGSVGTLKHFLK